MSEKGIFHLRVDPELKEEVKKLAEQDGRSLTNYVEIILKREVSANQSKK